MSGERGRGASARATPYGGQAVVEGVLVRGVDRWAVAVRGPDDAIVVERHEAPRAADDHPVLSRPLVRGLHALVVSLAIGARALRISVRHADRDGTAAGTAGGDEELAALGRAAAGEPAMGRTMLGATLSFVAVFFVLPVLLVEGLDGPLLGGTLGEGLVFDVVESLVRIAVLLAYVGAVGLVSGVDRLFAYHGAEHQAIAAWEAGGRLTPAAAARQSTRHVRCGTNFLLLVMLVGLVVVPLAGAVVPQGTSALGAIVGHVVLRLALLPVLVAVAYELLRFGAEHGDAPVARAVMQPGLWLQAVTTREPDDAQREVAVRALAMAVPDDERRARVDTTALTSPARVAADTVAAPSGTARA